MNTNQPARSTYEYECPLCGEYRSEERSSIEAHVSAKRDDAHSGYQGKDVREEIEKHRIPLDDTGELSTDQETSDESGGLIRRLLGPLAAPRHNPDQPDATDEENARWSLINETETETVRQYDTPVDPQYVELNEELNEGQYRLQKVVDGRFGEIEWRREFGRDPAQEALREVRQMRSQQERQANESTDWENMKKEFMRKMLQEIKNDPELMKILAKENIDALTREIFDDSQLDLEDVDDPMTAIALDAYQNPQHLEGHFEVLSTLFNPVIERAGEQFARGAHQGLTEGVGAGTSEDRTDIESDSIGHDTTLEELYEDDRKRVQDGETSTASPDTESTDGDTGVYTRCRDCGEEFADHDAAKAHECAESEPDN